MKLKKILCIVLAAVLVIGGGLTYFLKTHIRVGGKFYPSNEAVLDLRGSSISPAEHDELCQRLPDCEILWNIPFQGREYAPETTELKFTSLTEDEMALLGYFPQLTTIDATGCRDYVMLDALRAAKPQCTVLSDVEIGGKVYDYTSTALDLSDVTSEELALKLGYLPDVTTVSLSGKLPSELSSVEATLADRNVNFTFSAFGQSLSSCDTTLTLPASAKADDLAAVLPLMPALQEVDILAMGLSDGDAYAFTQQYPDVNFVYEIHYKDLTFRSNDEEIDLSNIRMADSSEVEAMLPMFTGLKKVVMCDCGIGNEDMDALNQRYEDIRFVWRLHFGAYSLRTDDLVFAPIKAGQFVSGPLEELKYCTDVQCVDVGHWKGVNSCEWARYMPDLTFVILADTHVTDISPLANHEKLKYVEIFLTGITDISPLLSCPAMEDLNVSYTYLDPEPVLQMTWLKNLWWACINPPHKGNESYGQKILDSLPDTNVKFFNGSSTGYEWRTLPNYFEMRDLMGMEYLPDNPNGQPTV